MFAHSIRRQSALALVLVGALLALWPPASAYASGMCLRPGPLPAGVDTPLARAQLQASRDMMQRVRHDPHHALRARAITQLPAWLPPGVDSCVQELLDYIEARVLVREGGLLRFNVMTLAYIDALRALPHEGVAGARQVALLIRLFETPLAQLSPYTPLDRDEIQPFTVSPHPQDFYLKVAHAFTTGRFVYRSEEAREFLTRQALAIEDDALLLALQPAFDDLFTYHHQRDAGASVDSGRTILLAWITDTRRALDAPAEALDTVLRVSAVLDALAKHAPSYGITAEARALATLLRDEPELPMLRSVAQAVRDKLALDAKIGLMRLEQAQPTRGAPQQEAPP